MLIRQKKSNVCSFSLGFILVTCVAWAAQTRPCGVFEDVRPIRLYKLKNSQGVEVTIRYFGALNHGGIRSIVIEEKRLVSQEVVMKYLERIRDIKTGPDGAIYALLNHPDILLRLSPTETPSL